MIEIIAPLVGVFGGLIMGAALKGRPEKITVTDFNCPYCHIKITGLDELDLVNHVSCIGKSEEDLKKNKKTKQRGRYFWEASNCTSNHTWPYKVEIFRDGVKYETWNIKKLSDAKNVAEEKIERLMYQDQFKGN